MQALAEEAEARGAIAGGRIYGLSLAVYPVTELDDLEVVMSTGVIKTRISDSAAALYEYAAYHGPLMMRHLQTAADQESELSELGRRVEKVLRLRRLLRDDLLTQEDFKSGCYRLLRHADALKEYVEGTSVRVSMQNGILSGSTVVDIAYNFDM